MNLFRTKKTTIYFLISSIGFIVLSIISIIVSNFGSVSLAENLAFRIYSKPSILSDRPITISDENNLLCINKFHVQMMSYIGHNNRIYTEYKDETSIIFDDKTKIENEFNFYGLTNCGDGYVYGTIPNPNNIELIAGEYSPTNQYFDFSVDADNLRGCLLSYDAALMLSDDINSILEKEIKVKSSSGEATFVVKGIIKNNNLLCEEGQRAKYLVTNFAFYQQVFKKSTLVMKLDPKKYYTNYSIFDYLLNHIYYYPYSSSRMTLECKDEYMNNLVNKVVVNNQSSSPNLSFFIIFIFLLQSYMGYLFGKALEIKKRTAGFYFMVFICAIYISCLLTYLLRGVCLFNFYINTRNSLLMCYILCNSLIICLITYIINKHRYKKMGSFKYLHAHQIKIKV